MIAIETRLTAEEATAIERDLPVFERMIKNHVVSAVDREATLSAIAKLLACAKLRMEPFESEKR